MNNILTKTSRPRDRRGTNPTGLAPRVVVGKWHLTECLSPSGSDVLVFIDGSRPVHSTTNGVLNKAVYKFTGKVHFYGRSKPIRMSFRADGYEWHHPILLRGPIYVATEQEVLLWRAKQELSDGESE